MNPAEQIDGSVPQIDVWHVDMDATGVDRTPRLAAHTPPSWWRPGVAAAEGEGASEEALQLRVQIPDRTSYFRVEQVEVALVM